MKPFNEARYYSWKETRKKRKWYLFWEPTLFSLSMLMFFMLFREHISEILLQILLFLLSPYFISGLIWYINENKYIEYEKNKNL